MKLPTCPEVCLDCVNGVHVYHEMNELADIWAKRIIKNSSKDPQITILQFGGFAEDEDWLHDLIILAAERLKRNKNE